MKGSHFKIVSPRNQIRNLFLQMSDLVKKNTLRDEFKINVNGCFFSWSCTGGRGFIICNYNGDSVAACAGHIPQVFDVLWTEPRRMWLRKNISMVLSSWQPLHIDVSWCVLSLRARAWIRSCLGVADDTIASRGMCGIVYGVFVGAGLIWGHGSGLGALITRVARSG
jgi:hypothetical protein